MDGLALIEQAQAAGLKLALVNGLLVMKGSRKLAGLVSLITNNKEAVVLALSPPAAAPKSISEQSVGVPVTETPEIIEQRIGFADSTSQKPTPPTVPVSIIADPIIPCRRGCDGRVLRELRVMTGGLCWRCWEQSLRSRIEPGASQPPAPSSPPDRSDQPP